MLRFYLILNFISLINAVTFSTSLGKCNLEVFDGKIDSIPELVDIIKYETHKLTNEFGKIKKQNFSIHIFNNKNKFDSSACCIPEWGIAVAKKSTDINMYPDKIIMQSPSLAKISYNRMKQILIHEINHIYMFRLPFYEIIPSWFKEGMAMHYSNEFSILHKLEISYAILKKNIIPLNRLKNITVLKNKDIRLAYAESAAAIEFIKKHYGNQQLLDIISLMQDGINFNLALQKITNEKENTFHAKFENYLLNNYNWIFLTQLYKYIYVILPIILIFGFLFKKFRNKKIIEAWKIEEELEKIKCEKDYLN